MTPLARTAALADAYDAVADELGEAIAAYEAGDKVRFNAGMRRVMDAMGQAGEVIVSGPLLPPHGANNVVRFPVTSPAAERQRRRRARARRGEIIAPTPVCGPVLEVLIGLRWLREQDAEDRGKVGDAISRMLADLAQHR